MDRQAHAGYGGLGLRDFLGRHVFEIHFLQQLV